MMSEFYELTPVRKKSDHTWNGVIVSAFANLKGDELFVVERIDYGLIKPTPEDVGDLYFFSAEDIEKIPFTPIGIDVNGNYYGISIEEVRKQLYMMQTHNLTVENASDPELLKHLYSNE